MDKVIKAGVDYVDSVAYTADDKKNLMWFGWALRQAFISGAIWQTQESVSDD